MSQYVHPVLCPSCGRNYDHNQHQFCPQCRGSIQTEMALEGPENVVRESAITPNGIVGASCINRGAKAAIRGQKHGPVNSTSSHTFATPFLTGRKKERPRK